MTPFIEREIEIIRHYRVLRTLPDESLDDPFIREFECTAAGIKWDPELDLQARRRLLYYWTRIGAQLDREPAEAGA